LLTGEREGETSEAERGGEKEENSNPESNQQALLLGGIEVRNVWIQTAVPA
jgi:hypothetical protein